MVIRIGMLLIGSFIGALLCVSIYIGARAESEIPRHGKLLEVGGIKLHIREIGDLDSEYPPIVLIHGASANLRDMEMSLGNALADEFRVILIDRPGRGYSERGKDGYSLLRQAVLIQSAVKALSAENPIIVGQSFGGAVALRYALQFQEEVSGLVLLAPVSHEWPGGVVWYNRVCAIPVIGHIFRWLVIPAYGQVVLDRGVDGTFAPNAAPENYVERSGLQLLFRPQDFKSNAEDVAKLKGEIIKQQRRYSELDLPVTILTGLDDDTVSPDIHSRALEAQIQDAKLTLFENTGHALQHSRTKEIVTAIRTIAYSAPTQ